MKNILIFSIFILLSITLSAQSQKVVLIEEGTGTWCQWCPRGEVYARMLAEEYPDEALFVAIHSGDPMEYTAYSDASGLVSLPSGNVDRTFQTSLDPFFELDQDMATQLALTPPASISVTTIWEPAFNDLNITVTANFTEDVSGDYRLGAIVVEDGVTGPSPAYDQSNSYSGGDNGPMGGYENLPSPVSASIMVYNHVGRYLAGGYDGAENSLPENILNGESHSYIFPWTVPDAYNADYIYVIGVLIDNATGRIVNAGRSDYIPGFANGKPFFHSNPQVQGFEGNSYLYDILCHDPEHDDMEITALTSLPPGLSLIDLGDGKATLAGIPSMQGIFEVTLNVNDGEWDIEQTFELVIGEAEEDWIDVGPSGFTSSGADDVDLEINSLGEPYVMMTSNDLVYLYKFENDNWTQQGNVLSGSSFHSSMAISPDNIPHVFSDGIVSKLVNGQWEQVGGTLPGSTIFTDIIFDANGRPFLTYFMPPSTTNAYQFNGTDWELAGTLTDGVAVWNRFQLDESGNPILIYGTDGSSILYSEVAQWDGTDWNLLGGGYVEPSSQTYFDHDVAVTPSGEVFAALTIGVGAQNLNIYQIIDGTWELIAENLSGGATESCNLETDNDGNLIVAFRDENQGGRTSVMKYDGNTWVNMGLAGFTNVASNQSLALDSNGIPFVAYRDADQGDKVSVKKFVDLTNNIFQPTVADYQLKVFPNPNNGAFILEYERGERYQIVDVAGQLIEERELSSDLTHQGLNYLNLNIQHVPNGVYFLKVMGSEGVQTKKVIKG